MQKFTDEELVNQYLETGRNDYFGQLYERYCNKVLRKCQSFTKDPVQAEDLTQDIFVRLIVKLDGFRTQARFSTWLYSIAHNYCTDQVKSSRWRREVPAAGNWDSLSVPADDSAERAEIEDRLIQLAMSRLNEEEQKLLRHKYQDNLSIRELAHKHELTESAVKMRLKRSRDKLRTIYKQVAAH